MRDEFWTRSAFRLLSASAHVQRMFLVHAKNDRLVKAVGALEIFSQVSGDDFCAGEQRNQPLEILCPIQIRRYLAPETVQHTRVNLQSAGIHIRDDAIHPVGRQETIFNALPQAVGVNRVAKIIIGVDVIRRASVWQSCRSGWPSSKYSRILRQLPSSLADPRWHSSTMIRSKKSLG